jgi:hypothetical protein
MVQRLLISQSKTVINVTGAANAPPVRIDIPATGYTAGTVKARDYLGLEKAGSLNFSHFLQVLPDTLAVRLNRTFRAQTFHGILPGKRYLYITCLLHTATPL